MLISVTVCTLNHAESLRRTLSSLAAMQVGDIGWEVLVVDNGSTDNTSDVLAMFADRLPLRCELEPERGLSRARNHAVNAARGDYILWTDDDVIVDPRWLSAYAAAFRRWPDAAVFGGPILPRYHMPVPDWILENQEELAHVFAFRNIGPTERPLWDPKRVYVPWDANDVYLPWGPNFVVRSIEQRRFLYDLRLGMAPGQKRRGEEVDALERIRRSGSTGYWIPDARVEHCARKDMQTPQYISEYFKSSGETMAFLEAKPRPEKRWFGVPPWAWRRFVQSWWNYNFHKRVSPSKVWIRYLRDYSLTWGAIRYWRGD